MLLVDDCKRHQLPFETCSWRMSILGNYDFHSLIYGLCVSWAWPELVVALIPHPRVSAC